MACNDVLKNMNRYIDGELSASDREGMDRHLLECENCLGEVERLRKLETLILSNPAPPVPDTLLPGVLRKARERNSSQLHRPSSPWAARWATAALLLFGLGLGGFMGFGTFPTETETPPPPAPEVQADSILPRYLDAFGEAPADSVTAAVLELATLQENGEGNS
jgi:predicted anti-sigma-YlaC factor YlaD